MTKLFGIPVDTLLVVLVIALGVALGIVGLLALRHPVLVKLGVRNVGRRRGRTALIVVGLMLGTTIVATALTLLFAVIGFSAGGLIIGFAFSREVNHPGAAGTVGGVVNMAVLGFAAIQQSAMGWILDRNWQGALLEGARIYDAAAYHAAFLWLAVSAAAAVLFVALTRETYCRLRFDADA